MAQGGGALDREDAGKDGTFDADGSTLLYKRNERRDLEEELRDDKIGACIDLFLEMEDVVVKGGAIGMAVGISSDADAKVVSKLLADERDEILGVSKAVFRRNPRFGSNGRICDRDSAIRTREQNRGERGRGRDGPPRRARMLRMPTFFARVRMSWISFLVLFAHVRWSMVSIPQ